MQSYPSFSTRQHQILYAHVRKSAAHHHFVIAAARAITVEVRPGHPVGKEILSGGGRLLDRTGGADMIGGHRVPEYGQCAGVADPLRWRRLHRKILEEGRFGNIGRFRPAIHLSSNSGDVVPQYVTLCEIAVEAAK